MTSHSAAIPSLDDAMPADSGIVIHRDGASPFSRLMPRNRPQAEFYGFGGESDALAATARAAIAAARKDQHCG